MAPLIVLVGGWILFRGIGLAGVGALDSWWTSLRVALAAMFALTASAHWGRRRPDLIRMVPPGMPRPDVMVTATGVLELLGAAGLLVPATAPAAATCLAILLVALFPANVRAAREQLTIGGQRATPVGLRFGLQIVFIVALLAAGWPQVAERLFP
jgi:uncharacterized membrane protein